MTYSLPNKNHDVVSDIEQLAQTISQIDEDISKYMCILNYLYFVAPYVVGNDILIAHFVYEALDFSPQNPRIISWVLNIYGGNPDCPFDEHDMSEFRSILRWTGTEKY